MPKSEILLPNSGVTLTHDKAATAANGDQEGSKYDRNQNQPSLNTEICNKHPLQNTWTLWFYKNDRSKDWSDNQKAVIDFSTVEDFWALFNHIEEVAKLNVGCDYSLFKRGVKPMWEDKHNRDGGRWLINLDRKQRAPELNKFWLEIMLLMIGEAFGEAYGKYVCGAVVSVRPKNDKIGVWLGSANDEQAITHIGRKIKESLGIGVKITFEMHEDSKNRNSSQNRVKYRV